MGFPVGSVSKESACNTGDPGSVSGLGRSPGERNGNPLQYSRLEKSHGQRSLASYSSVDHKESDTTEGLSTHTCTHCNLVKTVISQQVQYEIHDKVIGQLDARLLY